MRQVYKSRGLSVTKFSPGAGNWRQNVEHIASHIKVRESTTAHTPTESGSIPLLVIVNNNDNNYIVNNNNISLMTHSPEHTNKDKVSHDTNILTNLFRFTAS